MNFENRMKKTSNKIMKRISLKLKPPAAFVVAIISSQEYAKRSLPNGTLVLKK